MSKELVAENWWQPWRERANCRGVSPDIFFPDRGQDYVPAKKICAACEVKVECLDYAMEMNEKFGIWGGKPERQRRMLRHERRLRLTG